MSTTYEINDRDEVIPYASGRRCTDTRAWREATELEIQQRDEIKRLEDTIKHLQSMARKFVEDYLNIPWGNDGDCGATRLVNAFDCDINQPTP